MQDETQTLATKYPVNEIFETIQGEGVYTGTPAVFIRLQGCDVGCPWCDTKHTWVPNGKYKVISIKEKKLEPEWAEMTVDAICKKLLTLRPVHVVITGGEPLMHDLNPLLKMLIKLRYTVQIETSGAYLLPNYTTHLTVSPKINMPGGFKLNRVTLSCASEFKMPVGKQEDIDKFIEMLEQCGLQHTKNPIYLQPLSQSKKATELCVQACMKYNWRLSVQTHKYIGLP